jgi:hypothetical protein
MAIHPGRRKQGNLVKFHPSITPTKELHGHLQSAGSNRLEINLQGATPCPTTLNTNG